MKFDKEMCGGEYMVEKAFMLSGLDTEDLPKELWDKLDDLVQNLWYASIARKIYYAKTEKDRDKIFDDEWFDSFTWVDDEGNVRCDDDTIDEMLSYYKERDQEEEEKDRAERERYTNLIRDARTKYPGKDLKFDKDSGEYIPVD